MTSRLFHYSFSRHSWLNPESRKYLKKIDFCLRRNGDSFEFLRSYKGHISADQNISRRRFMLLSAVAASAPLITNLSGMIPDAEAAKEVKTSKKDISGHTNPECNGCQVCTIFFSNCLAMNNRVCWRKPAVPDRSVERA